MFNFNRRKIFMLVYILNRSKRIISTTPILSAKKFSDIPGPLSLPGVGTLYQYLPFVGPYKFDRLHHNGLKKLKKYGPVVREQMVPGVNVVWLFKPEDIEAMFRCEGKYPQRRSHLALEKYRLDRPNVYNTGGLLPTFSSVVKGYLLVAAVCFINSTILKMCSYVYAVDMLN